MRQLVKWVDARQKTSGGIVLWGDLRVLAIAIDDNSARLELPTDKYIEAANKLDKAKSEIAQLKQELDAAQTDARRAKNRFLNAAWDSGHYERTIATLKKERNEAQQDCIIAENESQRLTKELANARADAAQARKSFAGWRAAQRLTEERDTLAEKLEKVRDLYKATDYRTWCGLVTLNSLREQLGDILDS